ncbi:MAG: hypothetical protein H6Q71_2362 [Firmicutes bacterium]|nr:hypothetical protein [Bacillota bacterium]
MSDFFFFRIAEQKIQEAIEQGELDNLPGKGKPLIFDDAQIPQELRSSYKILKNNGVLPTEMALKREIVSLESLLQVCLCEDNKENLRKQLSNKQVQLGILMDKRKRRK